jgi:hypothetical protein
MREWRCVRNHRRHNDRVRITGENPGAGAVVSRRSPDAEKRGGRHVPPELHGERAGVVHDNHIAVGLVGWSEPVYQVVRHQ